MVTVFGGGGGGANAGDASDMDADNWTETDAWMDRQMRN